MIVRVSVTTQTLLRRPILDAFHSLHLRRLLACNIILYRYRLDPHPLVDLELNLQQEPCSAVI